MCGSRPRRLLSPSGLRRYKIDPFTVSVEQNIELLLKIDARVAVGRWRYAGRSEPEFQSREQWFVSSEGADIHQTKLVTGAGYTAYAFAGNEVQNGRIPIRCGQWQETKGTN